MHDLALRTKRLGVYLALAAFGAGCAPINAKNVAAELPTATVPGSYRVGASDGLTVRVLPDPPIERTVTVRPDGMVTMDLIGDVQAQGRTLDEIGGEIEQRIAEYRVEPRVSISLDSPASTAVTVLGQVNGPQTFPLPREIRVSEAVAQCGGPTELAASSRVRVIRRAGDQTTTYLVNLDHILAGDGTTDIFVKPGDLVHVPPAATVEAGLALQRALYPLEVVMRTIAGPILGFLIRGN